MIDRRFYGTVLVIIALMITGSVLSGCDELVDATHGAKGTASMQGRRSQRNADALSLSNDNSKPDQ